MARILKLDGTELCRLLAFVRFGDSAFAQARADEASTLKGLSTDVLFEDDRGQRFRGGIVSAAPGSRSGPFASLIIKAALLLDERSRPGSASAP